MFAFLKQMESRRKSLQLEAKSIQNAESMDISEKFLEILQLSFEIKNLIKDNKISQEKIKKIKMIENRMDMLFHNVINALENTKFDDVVALATAYYNLGLVHVNSMKNVDELQFASTSFNICLELLKGKEINCKAILTSISALNELNSVYHKLKQDKFSYTFLQLAMELYLAYTKRDDYPDPIYVATIIGMEEEESNPRIILESLHFITLQKIGAEYFLQPKDKHEFITYMHNLLNKQLSEMISEGKRFEKNCLDWALTLFDMSTYFIVNNRFTEARNYLVAADYVTHRFYEDTLKTMNQDDESSDLSKLQFLYSSDSYEYVCGTSAKSWGTYGVLFLRFWLKRYLQSKDKKSDETDNSKLTKSGKESTELLMFSQKELKHMANQITDTCILNFTDAELFFMKILRYFDAAKAYFNADNDIESYAKIILEISRAYKYLAGFEQRRDIQLELHKRRVDYLEDVCKKFHTIIDVDTEFQIYKRVWYEVMISCSTVMDLMFEETYDNNVPTKEISKEIKRFAKLILGNVDLCLSVV